MAWTRPRSTLALQSGDLHRDTLRDTARARRIRVAPRQTARGLFLPWPRPVVRAASRATASGLPPRTSTRDRAAWREHSDGRSENTGERFMLVDRISAQAPTRCDVTESP